MKIRMMLDDSDTQQGFLNLCLGMQQEEQEDVKLHDMQTLDEFADDGELEELHIIDVFEYMPVLNVVEMIDRWLKKIAFNGTVILCGTDAYRVAKEFSLQRMTIEDFNVSLHGMPPMVKQVNLTMPGLVRHLEKQGFKVMKSRYDGFGFIIEAVRE